MKINRVDRYLSTVQSMLERHKTKLVSLGMGFIFGRVINETSTEHSGYGEVLIRLFSIFKRDTNWLSWVALLLIIIVPVLVHILSKRERRRDYRKLFESVLRPNRGQLLAPFNGLAWNDNLSLLTSTRLRDGWATADIHFDHDPSFFDLPKLHCRAYKDYFAEKREALRFCDDGTKVMLRAIPTYFSDTPTLTLQTRLNKYSEIQYYKDTVAVHPVGAQDIIGNALKGTIEFPHSLSMHLVVETSDSKLLLTQRSHNVRYFPGRWSFSVEEQLSITDMSVVHGDIVYAWISRLLHEELALEQSECRSENNRIMSIFVEGNILNISLCAVAKIVPTSVELDARLKLLPRPDNEFCEWVFLDYSDLIKELLAGSRLYHPTAGYRMLFALIRRYGEAETLHRLSTYSAV